MTERCGSRARRTAVRSSSSSWRATVRRRQSHRTAAPRSPRCSRPGSAPCRWTRAISRDAGHLRRADRARARLRGCGIAGDERPLVALLRVRALHSQQRFRGADRDCITIESAKRWRRTCPPTACAGSTAAWLADAGGAADRRSGGAVRALSAAPATASARRSRPVLAARKAMAALAFDRAASLYRHALDADTDLAGARRMEGRSSPRRWPMPAVPRRRPRCTCAAADGTERRGAWSSSGAAAEQFLIGGHIDRGMEVTRDVLAGRRHRAASHARCASLASLLWHRARLRWRGLRVRRSGRRRRSPPRICCASTPAGR